MKSVVVTGGAGFIGSHLAEELAGLGYRVIILDDLSAGKMENIKDLLSNPNVKFVEGSIIDYELLDKLFRGVEYVFHHAAIASVPRSIEDPEATHRINLGGTLNVLSAAKKNMVKKVVYASSSAVYGDIPSFPKREDMLPSPQSPYAVTKLAGEYYCRVFHHAYGLPTFSLRYFNVYGPRQDPNSQYAAVIPSFIHRCRENKPPIIFGDGEQTRDFTFVKDVVAANILATETDACGAFNISRGESVTINRLAELVMEATGSKNEPVYQEPRPGDIRHSVADISRVKAFGYEPKYALKVGLSETILWIKNQEIGLRSEV